MKTKVETIAAVCQHLSIGKVEDAGLLLRRSYPFASPQATRHNPGPLQSTRVFLRDGFIDRYGGERLVFPPVLRVLSLALDQDFPFHPNWKTSVTHPAFWEIGATVDHVMPRALAGGCDDENLVTTSMARNSAKMNWTYQELGWRLHERGTLDQWDGLFGWFMSYTSEHPELLLIPTVRKWHRAAQQLTILEPDGRAAE